MNQTPELTPKVIDEMLLLAEDLSNYDGFISRELADELQKLIDNLWEKVHALEDEDES